MEDYSHLVPSRGHDEGRSLIGDEREVDPEEAKELLNKMKKISELISNVRVLHICFL